MNIFKKIKRYIQVHFDTKGDPTKRIISFWEKGGADVDYYTAAERKDWIDVFWKEDSLFRKYFQNLDSTVTLEIACGAGRHSFQSIDKIRKLYLLDSSGEALALAKKKFAPYPI